MHIQNRRPVGGRPPATGRRDIAPEWTELALLSGAVLVDLILYWNRGYDLLNWLGPVLLTSIGSWGLWQLLRRAPAAIWTPLFTIRAATTVFLGLGSLATELGEGAARDVVLAL